LTGETEVKEQEKKQGKTLIVNIHLTRGVVAVLIAGLSVVAFFGYLAWGQQQAEASAPQARQAPAAPAAASGGLRKYYRTADAYSPTLASTACGAGYHFASIWELLDTSNLEYAGEHPDASAIEDDMGEGPPTGGAGLPRHGWVRTGHNDDPSDKPGQANCEAWMSMNPAYYGTTAGLTPDWSSATTYKADISVWDVGVSTCNYSTGVWCVEN
jgi:hypothetical protein